MMDYILGVLDELLEERTKIESEEKASREARRDHAAQLDATLRQQSELGRSAIELENSQAYRDIIEPYIKLTLRQCLVKLLTSDSSTPDAEKNSLILKMQHALSLVATMKQYKKSAVNANKELERRANIKVEAEHRQRELDERSRIRKEGLAEKEREFKNKIGGGEIPPM